MYNCFYMNGLQALPAVCSYREWLGTPVAPSEGIMQIWTGRENNMVHRGTLLDEILIHRLKSPVVQKIVFDLCLALLPLILISLVRG